ncbi:putative endonuclease-1 [Legionella steigerwaltii]|uniref:Endonuclease-1 n=1 Tax=Legionella steigerwaltii TaxID=460 RepID=A0A378L8Q7_9GAMM|nr:endonuclease [Legionella steigerwaltii]KTD81108.1 putative endonuclease-1 [Legionella steigerwaltii]STY23203.1 putative endonuclease-1 [Legionella steigerwaltii]
MLRFLFLLCFAFLAFAQSPSSFPQSKKSAAQLFQKHPQPLYCQCSYEDKELNLVCCGIQSADSMQRAHRIDWKYVMAAEHFGRQFECCRKLICEDDHGKPYKGRRCCEKIDEQFRNVEAELYNLWPEVGMMNQAHSHHQFGMLPQQTDAMKIDRVSHRVELPDSAKGIVARAYLFMNEHYGLTLSPSQKKLFIAWNKAFKPKAWEKQWALQVALIEGYENSYMTHWQVKAHVAL